MARTRRRWMKPNDNYTSTSSPPVRRRIQRQAAKAACLAIQEQASKFNRSRSKPNDADAAALLTDQDAKGEEMASTMSTKKKERKEMKKEKRKRNTTVSHRKSEKQNRVRREQRGKVNRATGSSTTRLDLSCFAPAAATPAPDTAYHGTSYTEYRGALNASRAAFDLSKLNEEIQLIQGDGPEAETGEEAGAGRLWWIDSAGANYGVNTDEDVGKRMADWKAWVEGHAEEARMQLDADMHMYIGMPGDGDVAARAT